MNTKNFNRSGLSFNPTPDARMRETPSAQTLLALEERFGESHAPHAHPQRRPAARL